MFVRLIIAVLALTALALPFEGSISRSERATAYETAPLIAAAVSTVTGGHVCTDGATNCESESAPAPACPTAPAVGCAAGTAFPAAAAFVPLPPGASDLTAAAADMAAPVPMARTLFRPPRA